MTKRNEAVEHLKQELEDVRKQVERLEAIEKTGELRTAIDQVQRQMWRLDDVQRQMTRLERIQTISLEKDFIRVLQRVEQLERILFRLVAGLANADGQVRELMLRRPDLVVDQLELFQTWAKELGRVATVKEGVSQIPLETEAGKPAE